MPGSILARLQSWRETFGGAGPIPPSSDWENPAHCGYAGQATEVGGRPRRRSWLWLAALLAAIGLAAALVYARWREAGFHWPVFVNSFRELGWFWVAASAALAVLTYFGRALRWGVMLKPLKPRPSLSNLFSATAIGFTAVVLLGRAGEFVRPYLIASKERVPLSSQLAAWALERIYDLLAVLLVFGFAISQVDPSRGSLGPGLKWVLQAGGYLVGVLAGLCLLVLVLIGGFSESMRRRLLESLAFLPARRFRQAEGIVTAFVAGLASTRNAGTLGGLVLYTFVEWTLITAGYMCLFQASPWTANFRLSEIIVFMGFVSMGSVVQIPGVGGGVQVVSILVLRELFGVPLEVAAGLALVIWSITFVVIVPLGLLMGLREGINWRRMKELQREASV